MSALVGNLWLAVLLGWAAWGVLSLGLSAPWSIVAGLAVGAICAFGLRETLALRGIVAVLGPIGVVIPLLALRQMAGVLGVPVHPFGTLELLVFLAAYLVFLAAAMGALPAEIYRLGYAPLWVAGIVLAICAYGLWQGSVFLPALAVSAQLLWVLGWGSSNYFDHILHVGLIPAVLIVLVARVF